ncbi:NADPH-dependent FMN reductase [Bartonella choladocola]|uniref:NAD(P)H-dependent FMN reductase n=1 Tax=Bartonella choladocola TaxID=2750995 RepID=A0A1U9MG59_9HYPH|nr:NAD(P)H-dependent oxidoreductase [Bartonella choladocola]AQT46631.1 NAD(P)H-dependent FMN reductase [Bartonella choladocola]
MTKQFKVAILIGSLRKESYSRKLGKAFIKLAPDNLSLDFIEIGDLPLYNEDLETANPPLAWQNFRNELKKVDAVLFITPEYNRSIPAVLKNAIDVASRPYGKGVWNGKPGAVVSISQGALGGFGVNHQLRQALVFNDVPTMQQPEAYIGNIQQLVTEDGKAANESAEKFFSTILNSFGKWVEQLLK